MERITRGHIVWEYEAWSRRVIRTARYKTNGYRVRGIGTELYLHPTPSMPGWTFAVSMDHLIEAIDRVYVDHERRRAVAEYMDLAPAFTEALEKHSTSPYYEDVDAIGAIKEFMESDSLQEYLTKLSRYGKL